MDTEKAKNITIVFLVLLNAVLLICNILFTDTNKYSMTAEAAKNITEALSMNNISLTGKLIRDFEPKRRLEMQAFEYDNEQLKNIFMNNPDDAKLSIENNRHIFRTDWESLSINITSGYIVYRNRDIAQGQPDIEYAAKLCREFVKKINAIYPGFVSDNGQNGPYQTEEGLAFEYRQTYKGSIVNSNYLIITVGENGISRAEFMYAEIAGQNRELTSIYAPDEALLTCMHEIKNIFGDKAVTITQMDLVYHQLENTKNAPANAVPVYRFRLLESTEAILVNAYTNTVLNVQI